MKHKKEILLGVNIDHIATVRQARGTRYPEPLQAALVAEHAGADAIIGVRFTTSMVMQGSSEMLAYGTAVKIK